MQRLNWIWFLGLTACSFCAAKSGFAGEAASRPSGAQKPVDFNHDIRPILADKCFKCHGPDEKSRAAELRLDTREGALRERDGTHPLVPGKPDQSEAYLRIISTDDNERMPPKDSGLSLTKGQVELVKRWIEQGAPWQEHWAFEPIRVPELPAVTRKDWGKNAIDQFVLARLESLKLSPSPEASRETLIRRVSLDLTGLPPTPQEIDSFLADKSPTAYEKVVDRLLASPRFGETMALTWLDAARYADTNGYQLSLIHI